MDKEVNYLLIQTKEQLDEVIKKCLATLVYGNDVETTGLLIYKDKIIGIAFAWAEGQAAYLPIGHASGNVSFLVWSPEFKEFLETKPCVCHNAKFEKKMYRKEGVNLKYGHDTLIQCYLTGKFELMGDRLKNGLKDAVEKFFGYKMTRIEDLFAGKKKNVTADDIHMETLTAEESYMYACADADWTLRLHNKIHPETIGSKRKFLYEVEMLLIAVVDKMETNGIAINRKYFSSKAEELLEAAEKTQEIIFKQASEVAGYKVEFNINKPADVGKVLYEIMKLPILARTKKTKAPSTAEETLTLLSKTAPIASNILSWRQMTKQVSGFFGKMHEYAETPDGRIHTDLMQAHASSGRFASKNPNLQNQPKLKVWEICDNSGEVVLKVEADARLGYVPAELFDFLEADYSQVEFRVFMGEAQEYSALRSFARGIDAHVSTAMSINGISAEAFEEGLKSEDEDIKKKFKKMRQDAKTVNFGLLYGMGPKSLARELGVSEEKARNFYDVYFSTKPAVEVYIQRQKELAKRRKYIETHFGRPRWIMGLDEQGYDRKSAAIRAIAERKAVNTIIQGTAADIIKIALVRTDKLITRHFGDKVRMVLTVHDSILFEVSKELDMAEVVEVVKKGMEIKIEGYPDILVDLGYGDSWGTLKEISKDRKIEIKEDAGISAPEGIKDEMLAPGRQVPEFVVASRIYMALKDDLTEEKWAKVLKVLKEHPGKNLFVVKLPDGEQELSDYMSSLGVENRGLFKSIISCELYADTEKVDRKVFMQGIQVN